MKKTLLALMLSLSSLAFADPVVFNMELGKTTEQEVKDMYETTEDGVNRYSKGNQYFISPQAIDIEDLNSLLVIFDEKGILTAVISKFQETDNMNHKKFEHFFGILQSKYKLVKKQKPFVGDRYGKFRNGDTEILLEAPHMGGFQVNLIYERKEFIEAYKKISAEDKKSQKTNDSNML
ncbi:MAG: hypothetical protein SOW21_06605 [[Actinobacillus] rossii]|uniref:hypothetical protein n=1 Tax=Pasteurella multocida TaxID=747 RepID=UPI001F0EF83B|nr:hypothetical protein [Pasteurella multocida]MDY3124034.1 hypothetical protein [[Actinobacillus] rossii]